MRLENKVAIVTGGGGDIGRATALRFAKEGAKVAVADISEEAAKQTADMIKKMGGDAESIQCNMTVPKDVQDMADRVIDSYGKIDIYFGNAGVNSEEKKLPDVSLEEWNQVMDVNITGIFLGMKHVIPRMDSGGSIINTASIAGIKGQKLVSAYSASKSGVITLTKTAATEFGRKNIRVNAIAPGIIDTNMVEDWKKTDKWPVLSTANALRRIGEPEEIANAVLFLASDEASFITGETLVIDGGTLNL
ncbi:NAD(P)-dependent dehydrogenase, short-chain alcohol dehydrogenase family [Salinibacillus kushneri]|uniref:NAD(P)-dependent dehydrogenase, short-chain alcohol dehydrogenase family n=1 Tax=Salinibacillus kushneri TaxID=237682 RepID=A0A1H9Y4U7_9BACI|nr:glucose 1-dehydrogenase [Salinibacillus kushneri]SES63855.1 NAD(P)-dependent dehydrogenase, short-chain alcohol dehydrogenase family [Salinibacillus kushneri]